MGLTWRNPGFEQTDRHPVVCISWNDAMDFCRWLSQKTGTTITLPTEAQSEYTCRAGSTVLWPWGDDPTAARLTANLADGFWRFRFPFAPAEPWYDGFTHTAPAGRFQANKWGLYDRIGNANEWSLSLEKPYPYLENDGRNNLEVNGRRAIRGGSHCDTTPPCRSARRHFRPVDHSSIYDGFRVVQLRE
jgi:formylglycine-generating enzyme required for sulfatase activity